MEQQSNIEIKHGHQSFCVWHVYVEGEFFNQYDSQRAAQDAAERLEANQ